MAIRIRLNEWVDTSGQKVGKTSSSSITSKLPVNHSEEEVVYIWDMYIDQRDKGTWCSAEKQNGKWEGYVCKTINQAYHDGIAHLYELADEGDLEGDPIDYTVDVVDIPISEVGDYTLEFSGI